MTVERAALVRAVVAWRVVHARCRGQLARGGMTTDQRLTAHYTARDADTTLADIAATIPAVAALTRAMAHEHTAMTWALDTPRGRTEYTGGYRHLPASHPLRVAVRGAWRDALTSVTPRASEARVTT